MKRLAAGLLVLLASTVVSNAAPVRFVAAESGGQAIDAARSLAGGDVHSAAIVDIDGDGVAEVMARMDCDEAEVCRVVVYRSYRGRWSSVFDERVSDVVLGEVPQFGSADITASLGRWTWRGGRYVYDIEGAGTSLSFVPLPADRVDAVARIFGEGAQSLVSSGGAVVEVAVAEPAAGAPPLLLARMSGRGVCGLAMGCPTRLLSVEDGAYRALLEGVGQGSVALAAAQRDGWSDMVFERPDGRFGVYGWTGSSYVEVSGR